MDKRIKDYFLHLIIGYSGILLLIIMVINYSKRVFLAPNTSDEEIIQKAKNLLVYNGIDEDDILISYNINELEEGDLFISYDPPDLVIRNVYEKKRTGIIKMKSIQMLKL